MVGKIAIIGAGLTGSVAARFLSDSGWDVSVFEKSGGTGGRLSTRRSPQGTFDHGAQYVTAKGVEFAQLLEKLVAQGAVGRWTPQMQDRRGNWHIGQPGMSGLVRPLLAGIDVKNGQTVSAVEIRTDGIWLITAEGFSGLFDSVLVAIPSPQAYKILRAVDPVFAALDSVVYAPCWAVMAAYNAGLDGPSFYRGEDDMPCAWFAREDAKRTTFRSAMRYTIHAGGVWSAQNLERDRHEIIGDVMAAFAVQTGIDQKPDQIDAHRWRYARVDKPVGQAYLATQDGRIVAAGDGLLGGRAEAAYDSGMAAARLLASI